MGQSAVESVSKADVKQMIQGKDKYYLIDVRSPAEAASDMPLLPTAVNVPLPEVESAFSLGENEFQNKYKFTKPSSEEKIVVYCLRGGRASSAASILVNKGYTNVFNYSGSATDWYRN